MSAQKIRCRSCGEHVEGELAQIDHALSASSHSTGEIRTIYTAVGRTLLDRLTAELEVRRRSLESIEAEIARVARLSAEGK